MDTPPTSLDAETDPVAEAERLAAICREAWQELRPSWRRLAGYPHNKQIRCVSQDCCGVSAFALHDVLRAIGPDSQWRIVGGTFQTNGDQKDHAWVEGRIDGHRLIVDITADQFGAAPVTVALDDSRYHQTMRSEELPPWREHDSFHIDLWAGLVIWCETH